MDQDRKNNINVTSCITLGMFNLIRHKEKLIDRQLKSSIMNFVLNKRLYLASKNLQMA